MDTTELRTTAAHIRILEEFFRQHQRESGERLDLEWNRFCSSLSPGYLPELSRSTSWTPGYDGGPQFTSSDGAPEPIQLTRSQDLSIQSAPEPLSRSPKSVLGHDMTSTTSERCSSTKRYGTGLANRQRPKRRQTKIPEVENEYDPSQYLMANGLPANRYPEQHLSVTTATIPERSYSFDGSSIPSTPATALTDTSTLSSQMMSHNGSIDSNYAINDSLSHAVDMFRFNSSASNISYVDSKPSIDFSPNFVDDCFNAFAPSHQSDQKYLVTHHLDISPTSTFNFSSESNSAFSSQFSTSTDATLMKMSRSSAGSESDSSIGPSRSYRSRHQEHILQAKKCRIAPKVDPSKKSHQMVPVKSSDGSIQIKASIPRKEPYRRPQHPKLFCKYCSKHPEGFRGDHELQRHTNRAHPEGIRKFWICEDLTGDGSFLANCKACVQGKRYGADYNAAAHLRRAHFNPRKRGRKPKNEAEKRGGMGGGKEPPIDVLKLKWMREVEELVSDNSPPVDYGNDAAVDAEDEMMEAPELSSSFEDQPLSSLDESTWANDAYQYHTTAAEDSLGVSHLDVVTLDSVSDPCFYDVQTSPHAFASSEVGVFTFEDNFSW